ncbi:MAG: hypothetical protein U0744_01950 [Gemmataceae bacterium]
MAKPRIISMNPLKVGFDVIAFLFALIMTAVGLIAMIGHASSDSIGWALFWGLCCMLPGVVLGLYVPFHFFVARGKLVLEDEWLLFRTVLGKVRGQIPLRNIQSIELAWWGDEETNTLLGVGINLRRPKDPDTWWFLKGRDSHDVFLWNAWNIEPKELKKVLEKRSTKLKDDEAEEKRKRRG